VSQSVVTVTPWGDAVQRFTRSLSFSFAPYRIASVSCAATARSGRTYPACGS
jgi:hypothetical protein